MLAATLTGGSLWNPPLLGSATRGIKRSVLSSSFPLSSPLCFSNLSHSLSGENCFWSTQRGIEQSCRRRSLVTPSRQRGVLPPRVSPLQTRWFKEPKASRIMALSKSYGFSIAPTPSFALSAHRGNVISRIMIPTLPTRRRKLRKHATERGVRKMLISYRTTVTDTQSLRSSILNYKWENGRRYHAYQEGSYWWVSKHLQFEC